MAVRAPHLAFSELSRNSSPRVSATCEEADGLAFAASIDVIQIENDGVLLAAVDARVHA
jgi:hypothetical protein